MPRRFPIRAAPPQPAPRVRRAGDMSLKSDRESWSPDKGCELEPACLSCSQPICKEDLPRDGPSQQSFANQRAVTRLRDGGLGTEDIATKMRLSRRSIFRILRDAREQSD